MALILGYGRVDPLALASAKATDKIAFVVDLDIAIEILALDDEVAL